MALEGAPNLSPGVSSITLRQMVRYLSLYLRCRELCAASQRYEQIEDRNMGSRLRLVAAYWFGLGRVDLSVHNFICIICNSSTWVHDTWREFAEILSPNNSN